MTTPRTYELSFGHYAIRRTDAGAVIASVPTSSSQGAIEVELDRREERGHFLPAELDGSDWFEAFEFADGFTLADVVELVACSEGENDIEAWIAVVRLQDDRYARLTAICDYTGWSCVAYGDSATAPSLEELVRLGMTPEERERLGLELG